MWNKPGRSFCNSHFPFALLLININMYYNPINSFLLVSCLPHYLVKKATNMFAISYKPITTFTFFSQLNSPNLSRSNLSTLSTTFIISTKLKFSKNRCRHGESTTVAISTESNGEQDIGAQSLTEEYSQFRPNHSAIGLEATLNHMSKWFMVALFSVVFLLRRDAKAIWIAMGSILNIVLSVTLKKILNQERPSTASKTDPGMPSSHAQSIFFITLVVIFSLMDWLGVNIFTTPLAGLLLAIGSYFAWLRVSQGFHTISQVVVGTVAGSIFCSLWFWLWDAIVLQAFISSLWIRLLVVGGGVGCILRFALYMIQDWIINAN